MTNQHLRFAVFGTGFWSNFQIPAWFEVGGVDRLRVITALLTAPEKVAEKFQIPSCIWGCRRTAARMKRSILWISSRKSTPSPLVALAAKYRKPVICQKPMAPDFGDGCEDGAGMR